MLVTISMWQDKTVQGIFINIRSWGIFRCIFDVGSRFIPLTPTLSRQGRGGFAD